MSPATVRVAVLIFALLEAGWMTFDGIHALRTGSFVTPASGPYAGQVGPWRFLVKPLGIDPNGRFLHLLFTVYGLAWLGVALAFAFQQAWARTAMVAAAFGMIWFLPFGTLASVIQIVLLMMWRAPRL